MLLSTRHEFSTRMLIILFSLTMFLGEIDMAIRPEELQRRIVDMAIDGLGLYLGKKVTEAVKPYIVKHLKQYSDGAFRVGISLIDLVFPRIKEFPYLGDWISLWGRRGIEDILVTVIDKPAFCYASDENTIICYNFDTLDISVKIDGVAKTVNTDYTVSGTAEELTISLVSPLAKGAHDLVVVGNKVAFAGKIYV
jgi:hypothetical protein